MREIELCTACSAKKELRPSFAYYDTKAKTQYAFCKPCQREHKVGLFKDKLEPNGADYSKW